MRALLAMTLVLTACGSPRRSETVVGKAPELGPTEKRGQLVFMKQCNQCHPLGEGGLGPPINNKPFPALALKEKVRKLGFDMPHFSEKEISDDELDALVAYIKTLRKNE